MKNHLPRRPRAVLVALAGACLVVAAPLSSAQAIEAPADYTNQVAWDSYIAPAVAAGDALDLGDLSLTLRPGATASDANPIASVTTAPGAIRPPAGYNLQGQELYLLDETYVQASDPYSRTDPRAAGHGLDGAEVNYQPSSGTERLSDNPGYTQSGYFRYILTLSSSPNDVRPHQTGVAFYDGILFWDKTTNLLSVVEGGTAPDRTATSTGLDVSNVGSSSATLTATIAPSAASGTVTFKNGAVTLGVAELANGVATLQATTLTPGTTYAAGSITAEYGGDGMHEGSTGATTEAFSTTGTGGSIPIGVVVGEPQNPGQPSGLKLSVPTEAVSLTGGARTANTPWTATGNTGDVTVTDDRQDAAALAWTLSGQAADFTAGSNVIGAAQLAWTPSHVSGPGFAGAAATGLDAAKELARGTASTGVNVQTVVKAELTLTVPADKPAGSYSSTLTLTLI